MAALLLRRSAAAAHGGSSALFFPLYINTIKLGEILFFYAEFFEKIQSRSCGRGASPSPYNTTLHEAVGGDACIAPQVAARLCGPMTSIGPYKKA
jgi:hypothetical protein